MRKIWWESHNVTYWQCCENFIMLQLDNNNYISVYKICKEVDMSANFQLIAFFGANEPINCKIVFWALISIVTTTLFGVSFFFRNILWNIGASTSATLWKVWSIFFWKWFLYSSWYYDAGIIISKNHNAFISLIKEREKKYF